MGSYLVLLRVEFTLPQTVTSRAVRSYRTLSPLLTVAVNALPQSIVGEPGGCEIKSRLNERSGLLSVALAVGLRRPDVIWHPALWSPDFPLLDTSSSDCPVG